ncbi:unnamed protein product [Blepharisma stoltei]|uniref:PH domain-containing protein n=1 Tax=Blepharisma stoltei TaxID=1481888 RepID=A0AAU9IZV6_9CILI|nr:unnamed protein product [Blepharisma stoltei]
MLAADLILYHGQIMLYEDKNKPRWVPRNAVLIQNALLFYNESDENFIINQDEGRISMVGLKSHFGDFDGEFWRIDLLFDNSRKAFKVAGQEDAENWCKMLAMAASWSNYENFCSFQKVKPWQYLLRWSSKGGGNLVLNLNGVNSFALLEYIRGNEYITELEIQEMNNQVTVFTRILACFPPEQLRSLSISNARLTDKSFSMCRKVLSSNLYLEHLDLSNNSLTAGFMHTFFKIIPLTPSLKSLNLARNFIKDEGLSELFPACLTHIRLKEINLTGCGLTDVSVPIIRRVIRIKGLSIEKLYLNDNEFSLASAKGILKSIRYKRRRGYNINVWVNPLMIEEGALGLLDGFKDISLLRIVIPSENTEIRPMPRLTKHRVTIDTMVVKMENLTKSGEICVEDLADLAKQLSGLDFQFPKTKLKALEEILDSYINQAIESQNFYCLELLIQAQESLGNSNRRAKEVYEELKNEVEGIIVTIENILNPDLYNADNIPELNSTLDKVIERGTQLGLRGGLFGTAKLLQRKREEFLRKRDFKIN